MLNQIHAGDCTDLMLKFPDGSVDLVFADPPFNTGYDYDIYKDNKSAEEYLGWTHRWLGQAIRVLRPSGTLWVAMGDEYAAEVKVLAHRTLGLFPRGWILWHYTFGVNCKKKFTRSHTHLLYFTKSPKHYTFNDAEIRVPSARQIKYNDPRANPAGRIPDDTWTYSRVCGTFKERAGFHGCQMPEQLLGRIIKACSNPGDVVLDPFSGTASTACVSKKLGREYIGFELSEDYARRGQERVDQASFGDALAGSLPAALVGAS